MKLFTPREATTETGKKKNEFIQEIAYLQTTLNTLQQRLNNENQQFEIRLVEQRDVYNQEKQNLQRDLKKLTEEVNKLEKKREVAMVPVNMLKKAEKEVLKKLEKQVKVAEDKEYEADKKMLTFQNRLDDILEKQSIIEEAEEMLTQRGIATQAEADQVSKLHTDLNQRLQLFNQEYQTKLKDLEHREDSMAVKEKALIETDKEHKKRFAEDTKLLTDRRQALERFAKEIGFTK